MSDPVIISRAEALGVPQADRLRRLLELATGEVPDDVDLVLEHLAYAAATSTTLLQQVQGPGLHQALFEGAELVDVAEAVGTPVDHVVNQWRGWARRTSKTLDPDRADDAALLAEIAVLEDKLPGGGTKRVPRRRA
jgi:hypothetical protein